MCIGLVPSSQPDWSLSTNRFAEKEDQYEAAKEQLYHKDEVISSLRGERSKLDRDGSARLANLNQALMQAKQACAQLTDENSSLKRNESQLLESYEDLKHKYEALAASVAAGCKSCQQSQGQATPTARGQLRAPATPIKPIPEETEVDSLQIENAKLKQEFQCLQTNFQLTSTKSAQLKKEMKEMESSLENLQGAYDQALEERDDLQRKFNEASVALANMAGSGGRKCGGCDKTEEELCAVRSQMDVLQHQYFDLQDKLKAEVARSLEAQDTIDGLDAQIKALEEGKSSAITDLSSAQDRLQELEEQLSSYQRSQNTQSEIQQQSSQAIVAYEQKVARLKHEKEDLQEQLAQAGEALDEVQSRLSSVEESNKALQAKTNGLETQNQLLTSQLREHAGSQRETVLQKQLAALSEEHQALSIRNRELEETRERLDLHTQEQSKSNSRLQREASHHWELVKKLQKELEKQESCSLQAEAGLKERELLWSRAQHEIEDLKLELETVVNAKQMYEVEVGRLTSKLEELEQCNFELSTRLADFESVTTSVKESQSEARARVENLEGLLGTTRTTLVETELQVMDLRNTNELMEKENANLLSQVNSLTEMVAARNGKIETLQSQIVRFESDNADIAARITDLEDSHSHCASIKQGLQWEIESLKDLLESASTTHKESESQILSYRSELRQLQEYNNSLESINSDLQEKIKVEIAKTEDLAAEAYDMGQSQQELARETKMKGASLKSALDDMDYMKRSSEEAQKVLRGEVGSLESKCSELREACDELRRNKLEMSSQVMQATNEIRELQRLNSNAKSENECLMRRMEHSHMEAGATKGQLVATQRELKQLHAELRHQRQHVSQLEKERSAMGQELAKSTELYENLKESMRTLLEPSSGDASAVSGDTVTIGTPNKKKLRGILKNSGSGPAVLKVQNVNKEN